MKRQIKAGARKACWNGIRWGGIALVVFGLLGCEGGGGGDPWADFDFGANNKNVCLALGDSITAGNSYIPKLAGMLQKTIVNEAIPGSETSVGVDLVHPGLDSTHPGFLIILYGINDLIMGYSESGAIANLRYMVQAAKDNKTAPIIATLTPVTGDYIGLVSGIQRLNAAIRQMAAEEGVTLVDLEEALNWDPAYLLPDGLHPNAAGNDVIAATFYDAMK
ncbi:MAG: SGNH/GDSL hydrolase family protein [Verrucomicrobia bacterium]|nr:SGNH/GDSL hydrolase family protein [Verrucomicrobiota bacterium]MCG2681654.1 SGNH/GDSL hydrolase family protein [Kiritimatiellia bacterium]MBU4248106.1 SGNH/GDSL hydrolase family protein [Verrucomicrobiota bacterium]MBU4290782.1 SGNH/GDSL hydrolase family protein [Verrucomicrobiota bacterium]MBU4429743.1 SGNH/GDSL hydrolase family protein [Verrucomicrobiota bacterium]